VDVADLPRVGGVADPAYGALAGRYGHAAHDVLKVAAERAQLAEQIASDLPDVLAEIAYAARREQARSLGDVLLRRTRLALLAARELDADGPVVGRVAEVLAAELGWSAGETAAQREAWRAEARAEGVVTTA
jgi:glycerol-3-phosphate dehydrogenase